MAGQLDVPAAAKHSVAAAGLPLGPEGRELTTGDLYVVWSVKVLENWKALVSTDRLSGYYWEVTHNGARGETYVDTYRKARNTCLRES